MSCKNNTGKEEKIISANDGPEQNIIFLYFFFTFLVKEHVNHIKNKGLKYRIRILC